MLVRPGKAIGIKFKKIIIYYIIILIQKLFGDQVLVKILKHVDSDTRKQKSMYKSHNKVKQAGLNKSLLALRKLMMEIELNVNSTSNFFIEETEQENPGKTKKNNREGCN